MSIIKSASAPLAGVSEALLPPKISEDAGEDRLWEDEFRENHDYYAALADEALEDYRQGKTLPLEELLAEGQP